MGGVIQGGMLPQWEDDHGLIAINRGWAGSELTSNKFSKNYNATVLQWMLFIFQFTDDSGEIFYWNLLNQQILQKLKNVLEHF